MSDGGWSLTDDFVGAMLSKRRFTEGGVELVVMGRKVVEER